MKLTLERQIPLVFGIAILLLIIVVFFAFRSMNSLTRAMGWEKETQEVILQVDETLNFTINAETGARGFMITREETFLDPYTDAQQKIGGSLSRLRELTKENLNQTERISRLENLTRERFDVLQKAIEARRAFPTEPVEKIRQRLGFINRGKDLMDEIRHIIGEIKAEEKELLAEREANLEHSLATTYRMLYLASIAGILSLGFANFAIYREIGKRRRAEDDLRDANKDLESRVERRTLELSQKNDELKEQVRQREETENLHRQSEIFTRAILNSLSAHIAVLDREGTIISVNNAWENFALANCLKGDVSKTGVGQNYLKVCEASEISDRDVSEIISNLRKVLSGELEVFSHEYPCHSPSEERWFFLQVSSLKNNDGGGAVVSHINITDRKKAELKLKNSEEFIRSVFENSPDCVNILELDGTFHSTNTNGLCIMEIDDFSEFAGKQWIDFWQGDENELAYQAVRAARGGKTTHFEGFCLTAKGTPKWWDVSVAPIFDADGKPVRLVSTSRDITFRRESETEREELLRKEQAARKDAEIANRLRDEFLATVSHELRAPLNSILGWGRLLEKGNLDAATTKKALDTIVRNAEAQNRLIEDLLDVSRIISGKLRLEVVNTKPINIVEAALETVRPAAEAKGISLEIVEDAIVSHISGDPNRLQQVIWNLLSNAIKFTPNGGKVSVEIARTNGCVEIRVSDNGIGIREEFLPHVFDRFRQADASSIRKFGGLGLGLAIVRHITEMHGGTVSAASEGENQGSTFTVSLPVINASREDLEAEKTEKINSNVLNNAPHLSLDGLLILVVDDQEDTRQLLVQSLTFFGATVITAKSASEGLIEVIDKKPDVLVSDIGMPDEDGYSLIRKIRALSDEQQKNITAVALTAFTRAQDRMRALAAGYQNHVPKPVEPDELATVIASLTGRLQPENMN
jgi:PAS domain S-box-containing protein